MSIGARSRTTWAQLPDGVRHLIAERTGRVVTATSHEGGYSPGMASTLVTTAGDRVFVKAASRVQNAFSVELYQREATVGEALRPVAPHLPASGFRWSAELETGTDSWVVLAFDAADGPGPHIPWRRPELAEAMDLVAAVGRVEAPDHPSIEPISGLEFGEWDEIGAAPEAMLAAVGALGRSRGRGDPEELFTSHPVGAAADPHAATVVVAALTGMFLHRSAQPPPPGIPHVRSFQRGQGLVGVEWLRQRLR